MENNRFAGYAKSKKPKKSRFCFVTRHSAASAAGQGGALREKHKNAPAAGRENAAEVSARNSESAARTDSLEKTPHKSAALCQASQIPSGKNKAQAKLPNTYKRLSRGVRASVKCGVSSIKRYKRTLVRNTIVRRRKISSRSRCHSFAKNSRGRGI